MADVKITFHLALAKQSQAVKKHIADIKKDLESLNGVIATSQTRATRATTQATETVKKQKKVVQDTTKAIKEQSVATHKLGNEYWRAFHSGFEGIDALANAARQLNKDGIIFGSGHNLKRGFRDKTEMFDEMERRSIQSSMGKFQSRIPVNPAILADVGSAQSIKSSLAANNKFVQDTIAQRVALEKDAAQKIAAVRMDSEIKASRMVAKAQKAEYNSRMRTMREEELQLIEKIRGLQKAPGVKRVIDIPDSGKIKAATYSIDELRTAVVKLETAAAKTSVVTKTLHNWLQSIRGALFYAVFLAIAAAVTKLGQEFIRLDHTLREFNTIAQVSEHSLGRIDESLLKLSSTVPKAASDLAGGLRDIASSMDFLGTETEIVDQQIRMLKASTALSVGGFVSTATATKALVTVMNAYNIPAEHAIHVSDTLFMTMNKGIVTIQQLADELGKVTPIAAAAGISIDEVGAAMALMTRKNSPERSATSLARMISDIVKPTGEGFAFAQKMLAGTGLQLNAVTLEAKGLKGAIETVNLAVANYIAKSQGIAEPIVDLNNAMALIDANKGLALEGLAKIFTDKENLRGISEFLGKNGLQGYSDMLNEVQNSTGSTKKAFDQATLSFQNQAQVLWNQLSASFIRFANAVMPLVMKAITFVVRTLQVLMEVIAFAVKYWYIFAAATVVVMSVMYGGLVPAAIAVGTAFTAMWTAIFGPISLVVAGILAALAAIGTAVTVFTGQQLSISNIIANAWNVVIWAIRVVAITIYAVLYAFAYVAAFIIATVENISLVFENLGIMIENTFTFIGTTVYNAFAGVINGIQILFELIVNSVIKGLNFLIEQANKILPDEWDLPTITYSLDFERIDFKAYEFKALKSIQRIFDRTDELLSQWGVKSVKEMWESLVKDLPTATGEDIERLFSLDIGLDFEEFDLENLPDWKTLQDDLSKLVLTQEMQIGEFSTVIDDMDGASGNLIEAFKNSSDALVRMGYDANAVSETLQVMQRVQILKGMIDIITDMRTMADQLGRNNAFLGFQFFNLGNVLASLQEAYLSASDTFLSKLLTGFGSPEELAEIFAKQNYISQNVNQNVVIAPYIQIQGTENEEEILGIVDRALTEWATNNGFTVGR